MMDGKIDSDQSLISEVDAAAKKAESQTDSSTNGMPMAVRRVLLILALALPIFVLGFQVMQLAIVRGTGYRVQLPISGYDPRDLLAGHYITYRLRLPEDSGCADYYHRGGESGPACLCIMESGKRPEALEIRQCQSEIGDRCKAFIRGECKGTQPWNTRFEAGLEKYFIPEDKALALDQQVRRKGAWIEVAIDGNGEAQVVELLLE